MTLDVDYLVVGSGLTGGTIARLLTDAGHSVKILDRRTHVGGNVHDHVHPSGVRIHTYGPHYFRTSSDKVWEFVNRFASFYTYEAELLTRVNGKLEHWPVVQEYIDERIGTDWKPGFVGEPTNFEEASLSKMPAEIYHDFVKGYTEKQWGVPASSLGAELAGRFDVHSDGDHRLKRSTWQGIPESGYAGFTEALIEGIPIELGVDYLSLEERPMPRVHTIFTGPIDEYYGFDLGRLAYRGQKRSHSYVPDEDFRFPRGQINTPAPDDGDHVRILEWKHMMEPSTIEAVEGTVLTTETPYSPEDPNECEYPFPDDANQALYQQYRARADAETDVLICGRLGEYKYYDMDQAISRAMRLAIVLLGND